MIQIKNLTKSIDKNLILDKLNLEIKKSSAFGLLGSNGAGKSTLLRLLSGVYRQDSGQILIDGANVFDNPDIKQKIFFISDEMIQFSGYTLFELKEHYKCFYKNFSEETFDKLVKVVGLPLKKKLSTFSKGMKRQAIVIVGLSCQTEYLLLDEAFDGLDPAMRLIVKNMIFDAILDRQLTIIISSHNLRELSEICDTAAMLHNGKIVFCHETDNIDGINKIQAAFKNNVTEKDFEGLSIIHFEKTGSIYSMIVKNNISTIEKKIKVLDPVLLDIVPLTLEEIFIYEMEANGYDAEAAQSTD